MKQARFYRDWVNSDLLSFTVRDRETDILISAEKNLKSEAEKLIRRYRTDIIDYIKRNPKFETSLKPLPPDDNAAGIIKAMLNKTSRRYLFRNNLIGSRHPYKFYGFVQPLFKLAIFFLLIQAYLVPILHVLFLTLQQLSSEIPIPLDVFQNLRIGSIC